MESSDDLIEMFKEFDRIQTRKTQNEDWLPDRLDLCHTSLMTSAEKIINCIEKAS